MRRGLKSSAAHALHIRRVSIRRFPDEEGTEMSRASARLCRRPPIRRFPDEEGTEICTTRSRRFTIQYRSEDSPMRRGLKSERRAAAMSDAADDQKIPR